MTQADPVIRPTEDLPALLFPNGRELFANFAKDPRYNRKLRGKNELLAKAVGIKPGLLPRVWDMSLGLGEDAWTLARLGCEVVGFERERLLHEWLQTSFLSYRAGLEVGTSHFRTAQRLTMFNADSRDVLGQVLGAETIYGLRPDVIYFDPMYSGVAKNSALPRIEMQLLRSWLGEDADPGEVLRFALEQKEVRIVVKRPHKAEPLSQGVTHAFEGEKVRYDMYSKREVSLAPAAKASK